MSRDSCYWMMSLKRQNIYFLLKNSKSPCSPSMLGVTILLLSLSLLFLVKKNGSPFLIQAWCKCTTLYRKERGMGMGGRRFCNMLSLLLLSCFHKGKQYSSGAIHTFFSLLVGADADTQRDATRNGCTVNYQRTPWAEAVLVHTVPCTFLSCSAVLCNSSLHVF